MRVRLSPLHPAPLFAITAVLSLGLVSLVGAQSQEPKPVLPATPVADADLAGLATPVSGMAESSWEGPNWGVRVTWDPADWTVENEFIQSGYDAVQIATPNSTAYLETYAGFAGDAEACLAAAEAEIGQRAGVTEVLPLTGRSLPVADDEIGAAQLFGVTATLADGNVYRGVEYVECRTLVPGSAVVEITWQTMTSAYDEDFPRVQELFAAIELPSQVTPPGTPSAPLATPVA